MVELTPDISVISRNVIGLIHLIKKNIFKLAHKAKLNSAVYWR